MNIEQLLPGSGDRLRSIRLRALAESPGAFGTTFAEAAAESAEGWERQVREIATFVAVVEGCDMGLVRGAPRERDGDSGDFSGDLRSMWVAPEARRRGVATGLIDAVVQWARGEGLRRLALEVVESNGPAISLYTRKGFVPTGNRSCFPPPREEVREVELELWV